MRALWAQTIWSEDAFTSSDSATDRELKRYALPTFDAFMAGAGFAGMLLGMPSFEVIFDADVSSYAGAVLFVAGVLAFAGIAFPRLWVAEAIGKVLMLVVIGGYAAAMWVLNLRGIGERWIVALAFTALLVLPVWNLFRLGRERRARRRARARAQEAIDSLTREGHS
ncbi:hypothetical protein ACFVR6_03615 [Microbacterium sp. NPDC058021]|uniref:hypothetical protein n=1 Tax=Microbacterium sp. NPDC058021 TaxID=3346306 RepID=UPI0036DCE2AE